MNLFKTTLLVTALIAASSLAPASAADNQNFDVTLTISKSCDVTSTQNVAFGNVQANPGTLNAQGGVSVQCTSGTPYALALNGGNNSSNNINARKMASGTSTIAYQLYQDTSTSTVWGETAGTDTVDRIGTGFGAAFNQAHTVYAAATIVGTEPAGNYTDTVTATVTF